MFEGIEAPLAAIIDDLRANRAGGWMVPSLKFMTRHPRKAALVIELLLAAGVPLISANLLIEPTQVRLGARSLNPYAFDNFRAAKEVVPEMGDVDAEAVFEFTQRVYLERMPLTPRNQLCWCGSGLKAKRCHQAAVGESLVEYLESWLAHRALC